MAPTNHRTILEWNRMLSALSLNGTDRFSHPILPLPLFVIQIAVVKGLQRLRFEV